MTADVVCTLVFNGNANCVGTANLPGGTLAVSTVAPSGNGASPRRDYGGHRPIRQGARPDDQHPTGNNTSTDVFHLNY
jgi:hypothetical protein